MKKCSACDYWDFTGENFGLCKRYPPSATIVKEDISAIYAIVWPSTGKDDYCGEFIPQVLN